MSDSMYGYIGEMEQQNGKEHGKRNGNWVYELVV